MLVLRRVCKSCGNPHERELNQAQFEQLLSNPDADVSIEINDDVITETYCCKACETEYQEELS